MRNGNTMTQKPAPHISRRNQVKLKRWIYICIRRSKNRDSENEVRMRLKTMMLLLLCFGLRQFGYAQAQIETKDQPQGELAALRTDVRALQAEQQQIISRLDELKQLLQPNGQPARPQPPSTLDIRGENFRGDSGARVAIIEYADFECPYCG